MNKTKQYFSIIVASIMLLLLLPCSNTMDIHAATKMTLKSGSSVPANLYIGKSYTLKTNVRNAYFSTSNPKLATIHRTSGKLTLKYPGTIRIYVKSNRNKSIILSKKVRILRRTDYLTTKQSTLTLSAGQSAYIKANKNPSHSTDIVTYVSKNTKIATVTPSSGLVTAHAAGTAKIVAYAKKNATTPNNSSQNKKIVFTIQVYGTMNSVKQSEKNKIELSFNSMPDKLTINDFTVKDLYNQSVGVISVEKSTTNNNVAVLTLNRSITDGRTYVVSFHGNEMSFVASTGEIAKFEITPSVVQTNVPTEIKAIAYDKNGMALDEYIFGKSYSNITFTLYSPYAFSNGKLVLYNSTDVATARIIYRPTTGSTSKTVDSGNITIKAYVDTSNVSSMVNYSISTSSDFTFSPYSTYSTTLPKDTDGYYLHLKILDSTGKEVSDYAQYSVEAASKDMILMDTSLNNYKKYVNVLGLREGTASIIVKGPYNSTITTFDITIMEQLQPTYIIMEKTSLSIHEGSTGYLSYTVKDQMNNICNSTPYVKCLHTTSRNCNADVINSSPGDFYNITDNKIEFITSKCEKGSYTYDVYFNQIHKTVYVTVY